MQINLKFQIPPQRQFSLSRICCEEEGTEENKDEKPVDPAKDRRNPVPVEISIRYLASEGKQRHSWNKKLILLVRIIPEV